MIRRIAKTTIRGLDSAALRWSSLAFGLLILSGIVLHGASRAGGFEEEQGPLAGLPGRLSSLVGLAADDIQISGLSQHSAAEVLANMHVKPGTSLLGFDAALARQSLEKLPWVKAATVSREYPNLLIANVVERRAIAMWQNGATIDLIDETGANMGAPQFVVGNALPLVTGEGANVAAAELINQMSAIPGLKAKVTAAARVGARRWTLYLDSGAKLALPEQGAAEAMKMAWGLEETQGLFSKGVAVIDLRLKGQLGLQVAEMDGAQKPAAHQ